MYRGLCHRHTRVEGPKGGVVQRGLANPNITNYCIYTIDETLTIKERDNWFLAKLLGCTLFWDNRRIIDYEGMISYPMTPYTFYYCLLPPEADSREVGKEDKAAMMCKK